MTGRRAAEIADRRSRDAVETLREENLLLQRRVTELERGRRVLLKRTLSLEKENKDLTRQTDGLRKLIAGLRGPVRHQRGRRQRDVAR